MAGFNNSSIRDYCKNLDCDKITQRNIYQKSVENAILGAQNRNDNYIEQLQAVMDAEGSLVAPAEYSGDAPSWQEELGMEDPVCASEAFDTADGAKDEMVTSGKDSGGNGPLNKFGWPLESTTIWDSCTNGPIWETNGDGEPSYDNTGSALNCWQLQDGEKVGTANFKANFNHESTHVRQLVVSGPTKDVDTHGNRELEALQKELEQRLDDMEKLDCRSVISG